MNKLLLIYAAVIFIAGVIVFTIGELNKANEEEPETFKWMRILALVLVVIAAFCLVMSKNMA